MSNRLTFSLASLVLIFSLAFATTSVMAATGGPTVTFEEYSGVDDPAADPSGQDAHTQARDDFRVKITFNHPVSAPAATDVKYRLGTSSGFAAEADSSAVTAIWTSATTTSDTAWVVTLPAITDATATQVVLIIADDVVTGSSGANLKGNVGAQSSIFTLPPLNAGTVSLAEPKAVANARGQYTVLATFDSGTTTAQTLTPTFDGTYVQVMPKGDATVTVGASDSTTTTGKTTATITVQLLHGTEFVNIKIDPGYVKGSNTVKVPADDPTKQTPPMVTIAVSEHDPDARTFQIDVMATPQMDNKGGAGTAIPGATLKDNLEIKDNADTNVGVTVLDPTSKNERPADNRYQAILTYSTFDELPLTVTLKEAYKVTGDRPSATVPPGAVPPAANAPAKPDAPIAVTNPTNDLSIDVSWTPPASNGSAITGYTVKKYNSDGDLVNTFPDDDPDTDTITGTYYTVGPVPEAERGMSFTFTVTATNANGDGEESDKSAPYTVGTPSTVMNLDVNRDGRVDVLDLVLVAALYGTHLPGLRADVNEDGIVNVHDFIAVAAGVDATNASTLQAIQEVLLAAIDQVGDLEKVAEAPRRFNTPPEALSLSIAYKNVTEAFIETRRVAVTDVRLAETVALLETLLVLLAEMKAIPEASALLPNYPNPFNPETWIPYHLATDATVKVTIYTIQGEVVRELALGHQAAGVYQSKHRAAYWDGKNQIGEKVASGLYFYTLTAGEFTATRKMLIAK